MFTNNDRDLAYWNLNMDPEALFLARRNIAALVPTGGGDATGQIPVILKINFQ